MPEIKSLWKRLFHGDTPTHNRQFLERRIAYKLQESEFRKVDPNLLDRNKRRIESLIETGKVKTRHPDYRPVAGTMLTREYQDKEYRVIATADGTYDFDGWMYQSLSQIAREITGTRWSSTPLLLKGIVFGHDGRALTPWHSTKKTTGKRYRYYLPMRDIKEHAGASGLPRLPAAELESAVLDQLRGILRSPDLLGNVLPLAIALGPTLDEAKVTVAMTRLDAIWDQLFPAEQTRIVRLLVEKVIVSPGELEVRLRANGIERLVLELKPDNAKPKREEALA